jgi:hypothetical protein
MFVQFFTFGSVVWVINGFIVFLPQLKPRKYGVNDVGGGWTAWLGATIFEFGAVTALFEAMNRYGIVHLSLDHNTDFISEMIPLTLAEIMKVAIPQQMTKNVHSRDNNRTTRKERQNESENSSFSHTRRRYGMKSGSGAPFPNSGLPLFSGLAGMRPRCTLSNVLINFCRWTGTPEILTPIENKGSALENGVYWVPQIIGASGFVIAS